MRDFTKTCYEELLNELKKAQYKLITFQANLTKDEKKKKTVILRHDVDKSPGKALEMAEMEKMLGEKGTFYFRGKEGVFPEDEIKKIAAMGHEIGYHYEDLDVARGDVGAALASFKRNLKRLREIVPVRTVCMHGSPMSRFDNRDMWKERSYREFGIIGEPYFDVDFNEVLYLTDTGRRWDGWRVSIRDKVVSSQESVVSREEEDKRQTAEESRSEAKQRPKLHSTKDILNALRNNQLPDKIMLTIHPQRWTDEWLPWVYELVSQNVKNGVKYLLVRGQR